MRVVAEEKQMNCCRVREPGGQRRMGQRRMGRPALQRTTDPSRLSLPNLDGDMAHGLPDGVGTALQPEGPDKQHTAIRWAGEQQASSIGVCVGDPQAPKTSPACARPGLP